MASASFGWPRHEAREGVGFGRRAVGGSLSLSFLLASDFVEKLAIFTY